MRNGATIGGSKSGGPTRFPRTASARKTIGCFEADDDWHGFGNLAPGFNMLDPIKATVVTPGFESQGPVRGDRAFRRRS